MGEYDSLTSLVFTCIYNDTLKKRSLEEDSNEKEKLIVHIARNCHGPYDGNCYPAG